MSITSRVFAAGVVLMFVGGAAMAGALPADAETAQCGQYCIELYSGSSSDYVVDDPGGVQTTGTALDTSPVSTTDSDEDFEIASQGTVSDYYQAGLVGDSVNLNYGNGSPGAPDDQAFELVFAPDGTTTGQCMGISGTAQQGTAVSLQPCGVDADTIWIVDSNGSSIGDGAALINGTDTNFSTPYVLTSTSDGGSLETATLQEDSSGEISSLQIWGEYTGPLIGPLTVTTTSLPGATGGQPYSATLTAIGGVAPYSWSVTGGTLPPGLSLNSSTGVISGTPTVGGTYSFSVTVTDSESSGVSATTGLSITVTGSVITALAVATTSLPAATGGQPYSATLAASGGVAPYSWSVTGGTLPPGLSLNSSTGVISGTPDVAGTYSFTVTVTDSQSPAMTASKTLSISVSGPVITAIRPDSGPVTGFTPLEITGTGLSCPARDTGCKVTVTFGGKPAVVNPVRSDLILADSPPGTRAGTVTVTVTVGGVSSQATAATKFTYAGVL
jgi:Putative Ig domain/IPT/TIG domain